MDVFLFFHGERALAPLVCGVGLLGFVVAPCLAAIGFYRICSGLVSDNAFRKSLYSIGIFTVVSFAIYASFTYFFFQWESQPQIHYILYCLTIPFGIAASIGLVLNTQSTLIAVLIGVILNLTAMIGFVSLLKDRKKG